MDHKMSKSRTKTDTTVAASETTGAATVTAETLVPEPLTPAQIEDLKNRAAKADDNWERLLRVTADLENFKEAGVARARGGHQIR